jgi:trk system potassium uptake protein TrkH
MAEAQHAQLNQTQKSGAIPRQPSRASIGIGRQARLAVGFFSVAVLLTKHGFMVGVDAVLAVHIIEAFLAGCYVADLALVCYRTRRLASLLEGWRFEFALACLFGLVAVALGMSVQTRVAISGWFEQEPQEIWILLLELYLLLNVLLQLLRLHRRLLFRSARPEWILAGSFGILILAGTLLLILPRSSADPAEPLSLMDAFFTATSASCVTGLTIRDTGTALSLLGQTVVAVLMQCGGLGIMTFVAFLAVTSSEALPVPHTLAFRRLVGARTPAVLKRQVLAIILFTLLVELLGAACLFAFLPAEQEGLSRVGWSLFHSISAFCNAGFSLSPASVTEYQDNPGVMLTLAVLIVLGGLGFLVVTDLLGLQLSRLPLIRRLPWVRRYNQRVAVYRLPLQTRLSVVVTALLIVIGFAGFWLLEAGHVLAGKPLSAQFLSSFFQSITARTAGFNSLPIGELGTATLLLIMLLMFVGACPVSTGGGIKTVTLAVVLVAFRALIKGRDHVELFGRTLPNKVLLASMGVVLLYFVVAGLGVFGLVLCDPHLSFRSEMFEVVSALSTVGLSTGITAELSTGSKLILCALMFIGRVGPISLVLSVVRTASPARYRFPEEDLVVG